MQRADSKAIKEMDAKKSRTGTPVSKAKQLNGRKAIEFVGEVKQEFKRIEWTKKEELKSYTKIVLASIFLFGMLIYFIDLIIQGFLWAIHNLVKLIIG